jgi:hypothetical protein
MPPSHSHAAPGAAIRQANAAGRNAFGRANQPSDAPSSISIATSRSSAGPSAESSQQQQQQQQQPQHLPRHASGNLHDGLQATSPSTERSTASPRRSAAPTDRQVIKQKSLPQNVIDPKELDELYPAWDAAKDTVEDEEADELVEEPMAGEGNGAMGITQGLDYIIP